MIASVVVGERNSVEKSSKGAFSEGASLRSKRFQSSYRAKVRAEAKKRLKGEGEGRRGKVPSFPSPSPVINFFFCSCPSFLDEPREETLATQATRAPVKESPLLSESFQVCSICFGSYKKCFQKLE